MSAKRILEKYAEQRGALPAAIDAAFKNVAGNTAKPKQPMLQGVTFNTVAVRIEVE